MPTKRFKGRNHAPWITGTIIITVKKKKTARRRLKKNPSKSTLKEKYKLLRSETKSLLRESRDNYLGSLQTDFLNNTKRFWSVLKHKSKSRGLPSQISMASDQAPSSSRVTADIPDAIADLFNLYFASVFTSDSASNTNTDTESLL